MIRELNELCREHEGHETAAATTLVLIARQMTPEPSMLMKHYINVDGETEYVLTDKHTSRLYDFELTRANDQDTGGYVGGSPPKALPPSSQGYSAARRRVGSRREGSDGTVWKVSPCDKNGVKRWMRVRNYGNRK